MGALSADAPSKNCAVPVGIGAPVGADADAVNVTPAPNGAGVSLVSTRTSDEALLTTTVRTLLAELAHLFTSPLLKIAVMACVPAASVPMLQRAVPSGASTIANRVTLSKHSIVPCGAPSPAAPLTETKKLFCSSGVPMRGVSMLIDVVVSLGGPPRLWFGGQPHGGAGAMSGCPWGALGGPVTGVHVGGNGSPVRWQIATGVSYCIDPLVPPVSPVVLAVPPPFTTVAAVWTMAEAACATRPGAPRTPSAAIISALKPTARPMRARLGRSRNRCTRTRRANSSTKRARACGAAARSSCSSQASYGSRPRSVIKNEYRRRRGFPYTRLPRRTTSSSEPEERPD